MIIDWICDTIDLNLNSPDNILETKSQNFVNSLKILLN